MTPTERADGLVKVWGFEREDRAHALFVDAIRDAENEALERAALVADGEASKSQIVAPLTDAAWDECARTIGFNIRELKGRDAGRIKADEAAGT